MDTAFFGDHADGQGIITGNDFDGYAVFTEKLQGISGGITDMVFNGYQSNQFFVQCDGNDTMPFFSVFGDIGKTFIFFGQQIFRCAHEQLFVILIDKAGVFVGTGKGNRFPKIRMFSDAEILIQGFSGSISFFRGGHQLLYMPFDLFYGQNRFDITDGHSTVRQCTGLIQTDDIHTGKIFKGIQFLHQRLFFGELGNRYH